jgi:hypothetical protein
MGLQYVGFELSEKYYKKSNDRLEKEKAQLTFFDIGMERNANYE